MVVEHQMRGCHVGQVGGDVAAADVNLAILHILGMHKFDLLNQVQLFEQYSAYQAVKITACD